jgi:hypothetical protein
MFADVSHFSMAGFPVAIADQQAFARQLEGFANQCDPEPMSEADLICVVRDPSGGEIWIGLRKEAASTAMATVNPGFGGQGRARMEIVGTAAEEEYKPFEVTVTASLEGVPVVFDLADPRQTKLLKPGSELTLSLAAFSFQPELFKDEMSYYAAQRKRKPAVAFAANYFIPSGTFNPEVGGAAGDEGPAAYADFAGTVLKSELRTNGAGHGSFWWALVKTYGEMTVDVVLDPTTVKQALKPGMVVTGRFWLSGRVQTP